MYGSKGCPVPAPELGGRMGCVPPVAAHPPADRPPTLIAPDAVVPTAAPSSPVEEVRPPSPVDLLHALPAPAPWILAGVLLVLVALLLVLLVRARRAPTSARLPRTGADADALDLDGLARELIALADLAGSPSTSAQVARALRRIGLEPVDVAEGAAFDPDRHVVAATEPTADPGRVRRVAGQVRPGWRRGAKLLRPADVRLWVDA